MLRINPRIEYVVVERDHEARLHDIVSSLRRWDTYSPDVDIAWDALESNRLEEAKLIMRRVKYQSLSLRDGDDLVNVPSLYFMLKNENLPAHLDFAVTNLPYQVDGYVLCHHYGGLCLPIFEGRLDRRHYISESCTFRLTFDLDRIGRNVMTFLA